MKTFKSKVLVVLLILTGGILSAQSIELIPFAGYTFRNRVYITGGEVEMSDGVTYGATIRFNIQQYNYVELFYSYQETVITASSIYFTPSQTYRSPGSWNYILIGSTQKAPINDAIEGYGGLKLGAGWLSAEESSSDEVRFSVGATAGLDFFITESIGIQVGMHLLFPITGVGAGFGWSSGGGTSVGVTGWSPVVQFGFDGGLVFRIGS